MLEGGEYSPWVRTIFDSIKFGTLMRTVRWSSSLGSWAMERFVMRNRTVQKKAQSHSKYTDDRIDRRLTREPEHPDLWTKILEKGQDESSGGLSRGEHHSNASLFMIAGTETTATALSGTTYHLLRHPPPCKPSSPNSTPPSPPASTPSPSKTSPARNTSTPCCRKACACTRPSPSA